MTTPHPYRLRRIHNPEGVATTPRGWRFLYEDEIASFPDPDSGSVYAELVWPLPVATASPATNRLLSCHNGSSVTHWLPSPISPSRCPVSSSIIAAWTYITPIEA